MQQRGVLTFVVTFALLPLLPLITLTLITEQAEGLPFYPSTYNLNRQRDYLVEVEDPDAVLEMLAKLGSSILRAQHEGSNAKRGLDLGLGRGFSGSQAAKHLMGLAAANFAAGPGKKKRGGGVLDSDSGPRDFLPFHSQQQERGESSSGDLYSPPTSSKETDWVNIPKD